jgi:transposase-like protein
MNSPFCLSCFVMPRLGAWFPIAPPVTRSFVNAGSPTTSSSLRVRWYLRFKLSYRDLSELARELGVCVARARSCVGSCATPLSSRNGWQAHERPVGDSWRCDETYLKLRGEWVYLYRAVDKQGKTVESYLSRTRDITAAKAFSGGRFAVTATHE